VQVILWFLNDEKLVPRPAPGWLPSPAMPAALNRCSQRRTVFSWQPIPAAIAATPSPSELSAMIRVRSIQSAGGMPGACEPADLPGFAVIVRRARP